MKNILRREIITDDNDFMELRTEWNRLLSTGQSTPLPLTHEWMTAWWKNFAQDRELHIICVFEGAKLIAIAPLMKESGKYRGIETTFLRLMANGHSPFCDIIIDGSTEPDKYPQILDLLLACNSENVFVFEKEPENSQTYSNLLTHLSSSGYRYGVKDSLVVPVIDVCCSWDEFFSSRSRKFRKSINNKLNRLAREKNFSIDRHTIKSRTHPVLEDMIEISKNSWKVRVKNDLGSNAAGRGFLLGLVDAFGPGNAVQIWIIKNGEIPVAYEFHIVFDDVIYPIRADFDEHYREYSPGSILEYRTIKTLFEEQEFTKYDSCADNYWYLSNWADKVRKHYNVEVFGNSKKSIMLYTLEYRVMPQLRAVRDRIRKYV